MKYQAVRIFRHDFLMLQGSLEDFTLIADKCFDVELPESISGMTIVPEKGYPIVIWCNTFDPAIVAHECLHAIDNFYQAIQQQVNYDEFTCYLLSELVEIFYTLKKEKPVTVDNLIKIIKKL